MCAKEMLSFHLKIRWCSSQVFIDFCVHGGGMGGIGVEGEMVTWGYMQIHNVIFTCIAHLEMTMIFRLLEWRKEEKDICELCA